MENINIIEERENPLFKRKEIKFSADAEVTPSHADVRKIISKNFSTPEENIRIKNILGKFGSKTFTISANIYTSEQDKLSTEGQSKKDAVAQPEQAAEQIQTEQKTSTPDTSMSESQEPKKSSNKPKSNEPASEQIEEPKPAEQAKEPTQEEKTE